MKLNELVGKLAIRTKPVSLGKGLDFIFNSNNEERFDYSYTATPVLIEKVVADKIIYKSESYSGIFDDRWDDDNWVNYEELVKGTSLEKTIKRLKK